MKVKKTLLDVLVTMAVLALISAFVIILANSIIVKGVIASEYLFEEGFFGDFSKITTFDLTYYVGRIGFLGILIGIITLISSCLFSFFMTKTKHYGIGLTYIITFIIILITFFVSNNIYNIVAYTVLILFVNPFYTLIVGIFGASQVGIIVGFGLIMLLNCLACLGGFIYNKFRINLD